VRNPVIVSMSDTFFAGKSSPGKSSPGKSSAGKRPSISLDRLREDELDLDKRASLIDTKTDVDYRETFSLIWRCLVLLRFYWRRFGVILSMDWIATSAGVAVAPWAGKVLVDHVVLGQPLPEDGQGYPAFLLPVIDFLVGSSAFAILAWLGLWTVVAVAVAVVWNYVHGLIDARLEHALSHMVRSRLFESLRSLPITKLDDQPIGDSVYRAMNDVYALPSVIRQTIQVSSTSVVAFVAAVLTMRSAYPDAPLVVLFAVGGMPVYLLATAPFARMIRRRAQANVAAGTVFVSTTEEGMDNIQAVQSLGANDIEKERFGLASADSFRRARYLVLAEQLVQKFGEIAAKFFYWGFMLFILSYVISGDMTPGDYAVLIAYFLAMNEPATALVNLWIGLQGPVASARRVFAMMDLELEKETGQEVLPPVCEGVAFQDVGLVYPDGRRALEGVTFEAHMGEIVALAGPTGAGKTTLAYLIPRYHSATEGRVLIDGHDVADLSVDSLRSQITYVFQETETLAESIADNIRYGKPEATMAEVERVARAVGIHEFISDLPDGYETELGTTSSKLSVGQKQRIAIARGLIRDTPILILDEPTSALDPETEVLLISALQAFASDRLVVIIAHRLSTIAQADRIVFLEEGRVLEQGSHEELMAIASGRYRRFVELQND
jgi:ABC-type multidrug transport system fused ATPase/permease subunit